MPGSLADFSQEFIMEAVFDHRFAFFLGRKTASDWKHDPKYPQHLSWEGAGAHPRAPSKSIPHRKRSSCRLGNWQTSASYLLLQWTTCTFDNLQSFYIQLSRISRLSVQNKQTYMGLSIQEHYYLSLNFMAIHTQSDSSGLILHWFSLDKSFLQIKNKK